MSTSERYLLTRIHLISRIAVLAGIAISLPLSLVFPAEMSWQIVLAITALAVGIPHGAVDHLITLPRMPLWRRATFFASYLLVTGLVIWFIVTFNLLGFQLIVLLSAVHFGVGDASFISEIDARTGAKQFPKIWYSLAAGFTPVLIPLVNGQSQAALAAVNPALVGWSGPAATAIYIACVCLNLVTTGILIFGKRPREATDLVLLLGSQHSPRRWLLSRSTSASGTHFAILRGFRWSSTRLGNSTNKSNRGGRSVLQLLPVFPPSSSFWASRPGW
jgi:hypothetical protein